MVESFEEQFKLDRLAALQAEKAEVNSTVHRPHENQRHCMSNKVPHNSDAEKQPIVLLDQFPAFGQAFHRSNDAAVEGHSLFKRWPVVRPPFLESLVFVSA